MVLNTHVTLEVKVLDFFSGLSFLRASNPYLGKVCTHGATVRCTHGATGAHNLLSSKILRYTQGAALSSYLVVVDVKSSR